MADSRVEEGVMTQVAWPLVTIAIPTYNRADRYLGQALESALNQTYQNIEIIVSDNCSTDNTEHLVKAFKDSRIRYFKQPRNIGADPNWNFCLRQARGVYFLLLQDDELIDNDFVAVCMKAANYSRNVGIIRTGTRDIDADGRVLRQVENIAGGLSTEDFISAFLSCKLNMYLCGSVFNTKKLKAICESSCRWTGTKYRHWEDVYAEMQLAARFGRIDVKDIKASYRKHPSQLTFNVSIREWVEDSFLFLDSICDLVPNNKALVKRQGMKYFAIHNYYIASAIKSPAERLLANLLVFKSFKVFKQMRYRKVLFYVYAILSRTPLYSPLRFIKMTLMRGLRGNLKT
jgi:glycosyltransferase involved in cell wall biosynthesis